MKQLYLFLLTNFLFIQHGRGKGTLSIKLIHFNNPGGKDDNRVYCDRVALKWSSACDHYFYLCLDKVNGNKTNIDKCDVATRQTNAVNNKDQIDFTDSIGGTPNPIEIPIREWEGGLLLKVQVWDHDLHVHQDDLVDQLSTIVHMNASKSREEIIWHPYQLKNRTQLDLEIAVFCDDDSYPPHCTHCKASSDDNGHYDCANDGSKLCHPGWAGKDCKIDIIDECESQPCQSGGICVDEIDKYTCRCKSGYTGSACETKISQYASNLRQNNCTYTLNEAGLKQYCLPGYAVAIIGTAIAVLIIIIIILVVFLVCRNKKSVCVGERSTQQEINHDEHMYNYIDVPFQQRQTQSAPTTHHGASGHAQNQAAQSMEMTSGNSALPTDAEDGGYLAPRRGQVPEYLEKRRDPVTTPDETQYTYANMTG